MTATTDSSTTKGPITTAGPSTTAGPITTADPITIARTSTTAGPITTAGPAAAQHPPALSLLVRARALRGQGLTGPGGIVLGLLVLSPGVVLDLATGGEFGTASSVAFGLAGLAVAAGVRRRALGTATVLPPLLFVAAVGALALLSGANDGGRELVLDIGTTLAMSAPVLFAGTALALGVVLGRLAAGFLRR